MTQETKDMIVLLQLEFSAEIEQADHDPKYSYRIFQRKTGNPIYQACRFSDMFRFFNIGPSMKIEDIDIRIQWGRKIVMPAMIDTPRIRERSRLKLVRFYIESRKGPAVSHRELPYRTRSERPMRSTVVDLMPFRRQMFVTVVP